MQNAGVSPNDEPKSAPLARMANQFTTPWYHSILDSASKPRPLTGQKGLPNLVIGYKWLNACGTVIPEELIIVFQAGRKLFPGYTNLRRVGYYILFATPLRSALIYHGLAHCASRTS